MRFIVIDMQSTLVARAFERILRQDLCDCTPIVSEDPRNTAEQCRLFQADTLLMEVTGYMPWLLEERLRICAQVRPAANSCCLWMKTPNRSWPSASSSAKRTA